MTKNGRHHEVAAVDNDCEPEDRSAVSSTSRLGITRLMKEHPTAAIVGGLLLGGILGWLASRHRS
jgi:hypothetical protein